MSLYHHLTLFNLAKCDENMRPYAENVIFLILNMVNLKPMIISESLIRNLLNKTCYKINLDNYVVKTISDCLANTNCKHILWNRILASLHSLIIYDTSDGSNITHYNSVIENSTIINLACENCTRYLVSQTPLPQIEDITSRGTALNRFVKDACVTVSEVPYDSISTKSNIIFPALLNYFSKYKDTNNKNKFLAPFRIDDGYYPEMEIDIFEKKEALFGSEEQFNTFVRKCFN